MALVTDLKVSMFKELNCRYFGLLQDSEALAAHEALRAKDPTVGAIYGIGLIECCPNCHAAKDGEPTQDPEIVIRPKYDEGHEAGLVDWFLGIEARVCCHWVDYVRALSHEWWKDRAIEFHTVREDHRVQNLVAYRATHTPSSYRRGAQVKNKTIKCKTCDEKVTGSVCDNCGTPV